MLKFRVTRPVLAGAGTAPPASSRTDGYAQGPRAAQHG